MAARFKDRLHDSWVHYVIYAMVIGIVLVVALSWLDLLIYLESFLL